jgi:hypothetical protein
MNDLKSGKSAPIYRSVYDAVVTIVIFAIAIGGAARRGRARRYRVGTGVAP